MTNWQAALHDAARMLERAESIVTMGHIGPDGDALGSMLSLAMGARAAGKQAVATYGEPFTLADRYRFLDVSTLQHPEEIDTTFDVAVVCDCSSVGRLGTAARHAISARNVVVVDHHLSNDSDIGDVHVVDSSAASTTQLVYYLLAELGWELTRPIADAVYTGLVTDTGRFQYSNTTPEVHRIASELLAHGVQPDVIGQHVYEEAPFGYLQVVAAVMGRARIDIDTGLVWSLLDSADLERAGIDYEDAEGLIDLVRVADQADVACLLRHVDEGVLKGSLRSRGRVDVSAIAAALGGGGHHNAAGFTTNLGTDAVIAFIKERL